jgi:hypothetical protein
MSESRIPRATRSRIHSEQPSRTSSPFRPFICLRRPHAFYIPEQHDAYLNAQNEWDLCSERLCPNRFSIHNRELSQRESDNGLEVINPLGQNPPQSIFPPPSTPRSPHDNSPTSLQEPLPHLPHVAPSDLAERLLSAEQSESRESPPAEYNPTASPPHVDSPTINPLELEQRLNFPENTSTIDPPQGPSVAPGARLSPPPEIDPDPLPNPNPPREPEREAERMADSTDSSNGSGGERGSKPAEFSGD